MNDLLTKVSSDIHDYEMQEAHDDNYDDQIFIQALPSINLFNSNVKETPMCNLTKESIAFVWFQVLIEILTRLEHKDDAKQDMVNECRARYIDKQIYFDKIKEFDECYRSHEAIIWYTLNTFFFHLLNQALRTEKWSYISMNGVLSATRIERVALMFADEGCIRPDYESVVFELHLSTINTCTKPFADIVHLTLSGRAWYIYHLEYFSKFEDDICFKSIKRLSKMKDELEVLFSSGTIWRIESVSHNDSNKRWKVKLKLGSDNDLESIHLMNQLKSRLNNESACTFMTLGNFLLELSKYDEVEIYYRRMLDELPPLPLNGKDNKRKGMIYNSLAVIRFEEEMEKKKQWNIIKKF
ncbi:unnamed protein product [Didymodactylos carnosus]|uniref:Uncharacterized protein n=1 Tax=Didymodactylos carnosus TaxID=1234261 RepID=A0A814JIJ6_9BILA|nr:unnamed protein product [Didymodactylos carnosus]CAF1257336.1 unnamed protein product [Didymodactylos carnosus]CAF3809196.1 unnamed protein product [Didymodactylos carnosus]CAF4064224.1 unnamed protein product [Didymodactylos carnosus]